MHVIHLCNGKQASCAAACRRAKAVIKVPYACTAASVETLAYTLPQGPDTAPAQEAAPCKPHAEEFQLQSQKGSHTRLPMRDLIKLIRGRSSSTTSQLQGLASTAERARRKEPNLILTSQIVSSKTWQEAYALFVEFSDVFNSINTAALITHISKLVHNGTGISGSQHEPAGSDRLDLFEALEELRDFSEGEVPK
ncbi:hypothetical protein DUNSADRAFT_6458 [Dunaliella salina]|uniref:Encoded protein n=1 Tax=Dunaliella salina TaxID=3046 RepID=A0ABQ7H6X7_DUNSA|nr:hypothetical protein DUNSADRAFT_6458 [Dunaliella salina]|eukprot:KAF5842608.1 hypothetical protein DUNSADRAFT_6458 [Dunaliella salina]